MHCQKKMRRPCSFINSRRQSLITSRTRASAKIKTDAHDTHTGFTQSRSKWGQNPEGIPPLGKARGTLEYSHTGTFFMPSLLSQTETQRQTDSEFQIWNKPILEVLTNWKTTKNSAYQQWWQLKLLIGLQGGWFSGLNEMDTAPPWTPLGAAA